MQVFISGKKIIYRNWKERIPHIILCYINDMRDKEFVVSYGVCPCITVFFCLALYLSENIGPFHTSSTKDIGEFLNECSYCKIHSKALKK